MSNTQLPFDNVLQQIFSRYGADIINDINRLNALLKDYAPTQERERKLMIAALREGIGTTLLESVKMDAIEQQRRLRVCERDLVENLYIKEDAAHHVILLISSALGITHIENIPASLDSHAKESISIPNNIAPSNDKQPESTEIQPTVLPSINKAPASKYNQEPSLLWADLAQKDYSSISGSYFQIRLNTSKTITGIFQIVSNVLYLLGYSQTSKALYREQSLAIEFNDRGEATKFNKIPVTISGLDPPNNILSVTADCNGDIWVCGYKLVHDIRFITSAMQTAKKPLFPSKVFR